MAFGGIDIGTSSCKCTLFDNKGICVTASLQSYAVSRNTGHHEVDIAEIWKAVKDVIADAAGRIAEPLEALCISSFGESCALLDIHDKPIMPTMLYTDPRGKDETERLARDPGDYRIFSITGHRPNSTYTLPKLMWLQQHSPEEMKKVRCILPIASCIMYFLTGERVCDPSLASRTMMLDVHLLQWRRELLELASISPEALPGIADIGSISGTIRKTLAEELNVPDTVKIVNGAHDQIVAAIGARVFDSGPAVNSSGSVDCITPVFSSVKEPRKLFENHYSTVPMLKGKFATYATIFSSGILLDWFIKNFTVNGETEGSDIHTRFDNSGNERPTGILILPHFAGSASPHYDPEAKGTITGLTLEHTPVDFYQALQEGICYESAFNIELLAAAGITIDSLRIVGGGERSRRWNQMKADIYGIPCTTLRNPEAGATGSAMLAGVALGKYSDLNEAAQQLISEKETFLPRKEITEQYRPHLETFKILYEKMKTAERQNTC